VSSKKEAFVIRFVPVLVANGLFRVASSAGGAMLVFYLAALAVAGRPLDAAVIGALGLVANSAELFFAVPLGVAADRTSPRLVLVCGALLGALATQIYGLTDQIAVFFVARALQDLAVATGGPPLLAYLAGATADEPVRRGRVMGFYELSLLAGLALGGVVGGLLWDNLRTGGFTVLALLYLGIGGLFLVGAREHIRTPRQPSKRPLAGLRASLADPMLRRLAVPWLAMNGIIGMWLTHIVFQLSGPPAEGQYLVGRFSASEVGLILLGFAATFAVGVLAWSYALAYVSRLRALRVGMAGMLATCLWLALLNQSEGWPAWLRWSLVALAVLSIAIESGFTPAALAILADIAGPSTGRGATMGIYTLLLGIGSALGAVIGGVLARSAAFNGLLLGTVLLLAVAFIALRSLDEHQLAYPKRPEI
jgi:MFS family permease